MKTFEYFEPQSIDETLSLLNQFKNEARVLAGGTDLLVQMKCRQISPKYIVNIGNIPGLNRVEHDEKGGLRVGSLATIADLEDSAIIRDRFPIFHGALKELGTQQVKNVATIGGNLCNASPAADTAPALIALGASAKIVGRTGERVVKLEDFFVGAAETVLKTGEILVEIHIPSLASKWRGIYLKHAFRKRLETAIVNVAVLANFSKKGKLLEDVRIVLGAVAPTPKRAMKTEDLAKGRKIDQAFLEEIATLASAESSPISDVRATAEYRKEMVKVYVKRAFAEIM